MNGIFKLCKTIRAPSLLEILCQHRDTNSGLYNRLSLLPASGLLSFVDIVLRSIVTGKLICNLKDKEVQFLDER